MSPLYYQLFCSKPHQAEQEPAADTSTSKETGVQAAVSTAATAVLAGSERNDLITNTVAATTTAPVVSGMPSAAEAVFGTASVDSSDTSDATSAITHIADQPLPTDDRVKIRTLANGLTVYCVKHTHPTPNQAALRLLVRAGSLHEEEHQRGLAHFVEHCTLLQGTESYAPGEIQNILRGYGCTFGNHNNASTGHDNTEYMIDLPLEQDDALETAIKILSEVAFKATITDEGVDAERGPILDELRYRDDADLKFRKVLHKHLLEGTRYPERNPGGLPEIVANCEPDHVREFYNKWYTPDRMGLVIVGDVDLEETEALVDRYFGAMPANPNPIAFDAGTPASHPETRVLIDRNDEQSRTLVSLICEHLNDDIDEENQATVGDVYKAVLHAAVKSMLNHRLDQVDEMDDAPFMGGRMDLDHIVSGIPFSQITGLAREGEAARTLEALVTELRRIEQHGFTEEELADALTKVKLSFEHQEKQIGKEDLDDFCSAAASHFMKGSKIIDDHAIVAVGQAVLSAVDTEACNAWLKLLFPSDNRIIVAREPSSTTEPATGEALLAAMQTASTAEVAPYKPIVVDRPLMISEPTPGEIVSTDTVDALGLTIYTLSNGMRVTVKPTDLDEDLVIINSSILDGELRTTTAEQRLSAEATENLLERSGIAGLEPRQIRKLLTTEHCVWTRSIGKNISGYRGAAAGDSLETILQLQHLSFTEPGMRPEIFESTMGIIEELVRNRDKRPTNVFWTSLNEHNTQGHPHHQPLNTDTLPKVSFEEAEAFNRRIFSDPSVAETIIVGNVDTESLVPLIEKYLASIPRPSDSIDRPFGPLAEFPAGVTSKEVYAGDDEQCTTLMTFPCDEAEGDVHTRRVRSWLRLIANPRLMKKMRTEEESTYTQSLGYLPASQPGKEQAFIRVNYLGSSADVLKNEQDVLGVLRDLQENGPTDEELEAVKKAARHEFKELLGSNRNWSTLLSLYQVRGFDLEHLANYEKEIEDLTCEELRRGFVEACDLSHYSRVTLHPKASAPKAE